MIARASAPADGPEIIELFRDAFGVGGDAAVRNQPFVQWKYWGLHPLLEGSRGRVIEGDGTFAAHGCIWPIELQLPEGKVLGFHLIDWAAKRDVPGAGMQVFRQTCVNMAAAFSIGGSAMTRKILPAFGFKPFNSMYFLARPLHPLQPALSSSVADWKMPARVLRNLAHFISPSIRLPSGWDVTAQHPSEIPDSLWPGVVARVAVSSRSARLLKHAGRCPTVVKSGCWILRKAGTPAAYLFLVQVRDQVRIADYGPAGLDEDTSSVLGMAAQKLAKSEFPGATALASATSEEPVRQGLLRAGLRHQWEEAIKVLKKDKRLTEISRFRLTLLDWDYFCL